MLQKLVPFPEYGKVAKVQVARDRKRQANGKTAKGRGTHKRAPLNPFF
jgi:hypothetical protein